MSKKDYEKAARIAQNHAQCDDEDIDPSTCVIDAFCALFADEPRFDVGRFRRACVPGANVKARS